MLRRPLAGFVATFVLVPPALPAADGPALPIAPGPFKPAMESLTNYHCPDWFRDAKFGIWAHWGPQAVPMMGDWYAKHMYVPGHPQYRHHLETYGHPSTNGYKEIIPLWKAEKWDPDRLMALYHKAGARYFVSMGSHHDNFFLWNSKLHRWNAVNMGPHRDVVGEWQRAAKKYGLRFGVSEHLGASFTWWQDSHKADKTGPFAGVPYDGANPEYEDLYHFPAEPGDTGWYSKDPRWHRMWFDRIQELVDHYRPDLLYTDGGIPFGETGRGLVAHFYNSNLKQRGRLEAVYTCKKIGSGEFVAGTCVQDMERGVLEGINPYPWQTDTSIGDWFYNRNWKFRPVSWTIHMLVDIVSKNGNLLLNIVQRPDGSLDPEVEQALAELASWIQVNGEGIYGTRPWLVYGEGAVKAKGGHFKEDFAYSANDIRFTTKGPRTLYAFALGWPADGRITLRSLAKLPEVTAKVRNVKLLGHSRRLRWTHDTNGLTVQMPEAKPCDFAMAFRITCDDVRNFRPDLALPAASAAVQPDQSGGYILAPDTAEFHGNVHDEAQGGQPNIGFWDNPQDWVSWPVDFKQAGRFQASASFATVHPESVMVLDVAGQKLEVKVTNTGAWDKFTELPLGTVQLAAPGLQTVNLRPRDAQSWRAVNLRWIRLLKHE